MRKLLQLLSSILLLCISHAGYTQPICKALRTHASAKTTVADLAEDDYDVKYVKLDLNLDTATYPIGSVTTCAVIVAPSCSAYVFELDSNIIIDSLVINGLPAVYTTSVNIRSVTFSSPLTTGSAFTAKVYYHIPFGFYLGVDQFSTFGSRGVSSNSEPYEARDWWPCKQSLRDKIDSVDIWLTVPNWMKAGSNGLLQSVTYIDSSHHRYEWKERYPIDYYLISFAAANYTEYSYYMHFSGSSDSMLIQNYLPADSSVLAAAQRNMDSLGSIINYFSSLFGRYPFWKEKYGHCVSGVGGGMENQTMTTIDDIANTNTMVHELGHQWFGDNVTCGDWGDIIMNEGFATYTTYLYLSHYVSAATASSFMNYLQTYVTGLPSGSCYVSDTTHESNIFDDRLSYYKGAAVLHMLRRVINNDSDYFHLLQNYQRSFGGGNATIANLRDLAKIMFGPVASGISIDTFFQQWCYLQGFPHLSLRWNQDLGGDIILQLSQYGSDTASVPYFSLPVDIQLHSATGADTIVSVLMTQPNQRYHLNWQPTIDTLAFDPNGWLIYHRDKIFHDTLLSLHSPGVMTLAMPISVIPNPTNDSWQISGLAANSLLLVTDATGRMLYRLTSSDSNITIAASNLSPGLYFLRVQPAGGAPYTCKLLKQ